MGPYWSLVQMRAAEVPVRMKMTVAVEGRQPAAEGQPATLYSPRPSQQVARLPMRALGCLAGHCCPSLRFFPFGDSLLLLVAFGKHQFCP